MKRKDAIHENAPYILVEGPGRRNVAFFGKWLSAAAKADALWNEAIKDRIFKQQVELLTVIYIPDFGMAALSFVFTFQKSLISFMVPLHCELMEDLHDGYSGDGGQAFHLKADSDSGRSRTAFR